MTIHEPGIYFDLPEKEYHADQSLSKSGITTLLDGPEQFWYESWMNPDRPEEEARDHIERGNLWHCRILEPEKFNERYVVAPWLEKGFSNNYWILKTAEDMKKALEDADIPFNKSSRKSELEDLIEQHSDDMAREPWLWDRQKEEFELDCQVKGMIPIYSQTVYDDMLYAEARIKEHPIFSRVVSGGYSEVSIFWVDEETQIPMKCRVDKLKANAILDYKTLSVRRTKGIERCALDAIKYERYDIQAAMYSIGIAHVVNMLNNGTAKIEGDVSGSFIDEFQQRPEKPFGFIFQQAERPNALRGKKVVRRSNDTYNVFGAGAYFMQQGIYLYQKYRDLYGEKRWVNPAGLEEINDTEIYYNH